MEDLMVIQFLLPVDKFYCIEYQLVDNDMLNKKNIFVFYIIKMSDGNT